MSKLWRVVLLLALYIPAMSALPSPVYAASSCDGAIVFDDGTRLELSSESVGVLNCVDESMGFSVDESVYGKLYESEWVYWSVGTSGYWMHREYWTSDASDSDKAWWIHEEGMTFVSKSGGASLVHFDNFGRRGRKFVSYMPLIVGDY